MGAGKLDPGARPLACAPAALAERKVIRRARQTKGGRIDKTAVLPSPGFHQPQCPG
jgi:hypothetical protein